MSIGSCLSTYLEFEAFELHVTQRPDAVSVTRYARAARCSSPRLEAVSQPLTQGTQVDFSSGSARFHQHHLAKSQKKEP